MKPAEAAPITEQPGERALRLATAEVLGEIYTERARQLTGEGFTAERDDALEPGALCAGAAAYAITASCELYHPGCAPLTYGETELHGWGLGWEMWKPKTPRRDLIRAAAMIVAEISRLDRAAQQKETSQDVASADAL